MTTPLEPEQRQQLATLLAYCREMGGVDFYRGAQDATAAVSALSSEPKIAAEVLPNPAAYNSVATEPLSTMPRKPNVLTPAPLIDFSSIAIAPDNRAAALHAIQEEIGDCIRCPLAFEGRNKIVLLTVTKPRSYSRIKNYWR